MDRNLKQRIRKLVFNTVIAAITICPVLYILSIVIEENYYKDIICVDVVNLAEVQPFDGAEVFTDEWEQDQSLLINTDSEDIRYKSLKSPEVFWDKAYSGTALIEITWKDGWYTVLDLDMGACNGP